MMDCTGSRWPHPVTGVSLRCGTNPDSVLADGAGFSYDALIVAAGSQSSYYGHDDWRQWAPSLKSLEEATTIRHKILYAFEVAERLSDPTQRRAWLLRIASSIGKLLGKPVRSRACRFLISDGGGPVGRAHRSESTPVNSKTTDRGCAW